jgi:peptide deformylase
MTILKILHYPDPMLKKTCKPVEQLTQELQICIADMAETMVTANGVGLAAPQIGLPLRIFLVDIWWKEVHQYDKTLIFINPKITAFDGSQRGKEGCLSFPGLSAHVTRAQKIRVSATDINNRSFEMDAEGFLAVVIQHEMDHLNGLLMLDRVSLLAKKLMLKKLS